MESLYLSRGVIKLKCRRVTSSGDYVFGKGGLDYASNEEALLIAIKTKIKLLLGEWWEDIKDGFPLFQGALLQRNNDEGMQTIELLVKERLLTLTDITSVIKYDALVREKNYHAEMSLDTKYGQINTAIDLEV